MNCYNSETFLKQSIRSVLEQSYVNFELIFWDNLSTDTSAQIVSSFKDQRIKYFKSKKHTTLYKARNLAIKKCKGDLVTFLDCDDLWYKDKLKLQVNLYIKTNSILYGKYNIIDDKNNIIENYRGIYYKGLISKKLLKSNPISIGALMVPRNILINNNFDSFYNLLGDFDLWYRLSISNKFDYVDDVVKSYRIHKKSTGSLLHKDWGYERRYFYKKHFSLRNLITISFLRFIIKTELIIIFNKFKT